MSLGVAGEADAMGGANTGVGAAEGGEGNSMTGSSGVPDGAFGANQPADDLDEALQDLQDPSMTYSPEKDKLNLPNTQGKTKTFDSMVNDIQTAIDKNSKAEELSRKAEMYSPNQFGPRVTSPVEQAVRDRGFLDTAKDYGLIDTFGGYSNVGKVDAANFTDMEQFMTPEQEREAYNNLNITGKARTNDFWGGLASSAALTGIPGVGGLLSAPLGALTNKAASAAFDVAGVPGAMAATQGIKGLVSKGIDSAIDAGRFGSPTGDKDNVGVGTDIGNNDFSEDIQSDIHTSSYGPTQDDLDKALTNLDIDISRRNSWNKIKEYLV